MSGDPLITDHYRISVKREISKRDETSHVERSVSCWLHDEVKVGDTLEASQPRGNFVLDESSSKPIVLLSCGVGVTPLVSMLHRLKSKKNKVFFIHVCKNGTNHILRSEVEMIASASDGRILTYYVYRNPTEADLLEAKFDSQEWFGMDQIQKILPLDAYDVFLCGPEAFMSSMFEIFYNLGTPTKQIKYEFFGEGRNLSVKESQVVPSTLLVNETGPIVTFSTSDVSERWVDADESLLNLAERCGLTPDYSCRSGVCGSCECRIIEGDVTYAEEPVEAMPEGRVLLCCARPNGPVVLDL